MILSAPPAIVQTTAPQAATAATAQSPAAAPRPDPTTAAPLDPNAVVTDPVWLLRPSAQDLAAALPKAAIADGIGGMGYLHCDVEVSEQLSGCYPLEAPDGYHFASAAMPLTPGFRIRPQRVNGAPVRGVLIIPMRFEPPAGAKPVRVLWTNAPTAADVAAVFPKRPAPPAASRRRPADTEAVAAEPDIRPGGKGVMRCTVSGVSLTGCRPARDPNDPFDRAAVKLAPKFSLVSRFPSGRPTEGTIFDIAVVFDSPSAPPREPMLDNPVRFIHGPTNAEKAAVFPAAARDRGVTKLTVTEACVVAKDGSLDHCRTTEETPTGMGGAEAARRLVNAYQLPVWTVEGRPVAGAAATITIDWNEPAVTKPSAAPSYH